VQIVCPKCQAEYELDPPVVPFARDQDLVFRCSQCTTAIPLRREDASSDSAAVPTPTPVEPSASESSPTFVLKQEGNTYHVRDEAMLQRWIAERRIWPDDQVSVDGDPWKRVGDIEEYDVFFSLVEKAERAAPQVDASAKPSLNVSVKPSLFARRTTLDVERPATSATPTTVDPVDIEDVEVLAVEHVSVGEVVPDEESARLATSAFGVIGPDEPTMDMDLEEEDFFSEEQTAIAERRSYESSGLVVDDDDPLEWEQQKRGSMVMWWLMFLGALGGVAYLGLGFLNARDAAKSKADVEAVAAPVPEAEPAVKAVPEPMPEPPEAAPADSGPEAEPSAVPEPAPKPEATPASKPSTKPAATEPPAPPPASSAKREIDRGWAQIDRKNWSQAKVHFDKALRADPASPDGRLGMAYVNEHQGRVAEAIAQYCRLQATGTGEVRLEAAGRLRALGKDCP
jgi:hypothetical protein